MSCVVLVRVRWVSRPDWMLSGALLWALRKTYLRVDRWGPKVVVWVERAGWWCLSLFLTRRVTPPSLPGMTPMACSRRQHPALIASNVFMSRDWSVVVAYMVGWN
jgi:hypothetical protein